MCQAKSTILGSLFQDFILPSVEGIKYSKCPCSRLDYSLANSHSLLSPRFSAPLLWDLVIQNSLANGKWAEVVTCQFQVEP